VKFIPFHAWILDILINLSYAVKKISTNIVRNLKAIRVSTKILKMNAFNESFYLKEK
jgi:hypothetical protein